MDIVLGGCKKYLDTLGIQIAAAHCAECRRQPAERFGRHAGIAAPGHLLVRRNGPEGDYHLLTSLEFHTDTSELFQMIQKGHHNVKLDDEAWSRLITWMDLNAPRHGTRKEAGANPNVLTQAAL
jgi:hypothetical protein